MSEEQQAREQWEKLQELGVKAGHMFRPDPGVVLTFTAPDDWAPEQVVELYEFVTACFPDCRVFVLPKSVAFEVGTLGGHEDGPSSSRP